MARQDRRHDPYDHLHDDEPAWRPHAGGLPMRALELVMRNPLTSAAGALSLVMIGIISGNAVANQPARHPSPWFTTRAHVETETAKVPGAAPSAPVQPAGVVPTAMPRPRPLSLFDQPQQIQEMQVALRDHGFYAGPIDGVLGPATTEAVKACERRLGVTPTGEPNELLLAALRNMASPDPIATGSLPPATVAPAARVQAPARAVAASAPIAAQPPVQRPVVQAPPTVTPAPRYASADGVGYPMAAEPATESEPTVSSGAFRRAAREPLAQGGSERHQQIQRALVAAGYGPIKADGRWEAKTEAAVRRWELDHGYAQTGKPSQTLVYGLMVEPARVRR